MRPHGRRQPNWLCRPWDSPGKNTGVGCHFLLQCMKVKSESEVAQSCPTPSDPMDRSPLGSSVHGIFQARVLEWGAIAFSDKMKKCHINSWGDEASVAFRVKAKYKSQSAKGFDARWVQGWYWTFVQQSRFEVWSMSEEKAKPSCMFGIKDKTFISVVCM